MGLAGLTVKHSEEKYGIFGNENKIYLTWPKRLEKHVLVPSNVWEKKWVQASVSIKQTFQIKGDLLRFLVNELKWGLHQYIHQATYRCFDATEVRETLNALPNSHFVIYLCLGFRVQYVFDAEHNNLSTQDHISFFHWIVLESLFCLHWPAEAKHMWSLPGSSTTSVVEVWLSFVNYLEGERKKKEQKEKADKSKRGERRRGAHDTIHQTPDVPYLWNRPDRSSLSA